MSFKKRHRKVYIAWLVISFLVLFSLVLLLASPLFFYS